MKNKKNLTNMEKLYIIYCRTVTGFVVDPFCVLILVYVIDNPLDSLFLSGFVYFILYIIIRIPMMLYYHDV